MLNCCLCDYRTSSINNLYKHSNETHYQELNSHSRYSLTSCIRCTFTHANPTITKLHTELIHRPENKVLYITHHRFVSRARAIQQAPNPLDIPNTVAVTKLFGDLRTKFHMWFQIVWAKSTIYVKIRTYATSLSRIFYLLQDHWKRKPNPSTSPDSRHHRRLSLCILIKYFPQILWNQEFLLKSL